MSVHRIHFTRSYNDVYSLLNILCRNDKCNSSTVFRTNQYNKLLTRIKQLKLYLLHKYWNIHI